MIAITRRAILSNASADEGESRRIHRAQFSAITPKAIQDSFSTLQEPNANLSRSVDARQELDLRVGVAITRLLTWKCVNIARRRFSPSTRMVCKYINSLFLDQGIIHSLTTFLFPSLGQLRALSDSCTFFLC